MKVMQLLLAVGFAAQVRSQDTPITKVLTLLEDLQKKVLLDGEVEQKQYEKYAEFCEDNAVKLQYEIKNAKAKVEDLKAQIEKEGATIVEQDAAIEELAKKVTANEKDLAAATEIRNKEAADFAVADADLAETIDMLQRAAGIIEKSMKAGSFMQAKATYTALMQSLSVVLSADAVRTLDQGKLQALLQDATNSDDDFLSRSAPAPKAYESQSGSILATLEDMEDKAKAMRNEGQKAEMTSKHNFELLAQSLNDALKVDRKDMDSAKGIKAGAAEAKAQAEGDLSRTQKLLAESEQALSDLSADCQQKASDWNISQKSRAEELEALTQARKIIAEKTGGAAAQAYGLLEVSAGSKSADDVTAKVVASLQQMGKKTNDVAMAQLAMRVQAVTAMSSGADVFAKVRQMIQELVDKLVSEAAEEADHKAWCDKETAESQEKIADHRAALEKLQARRDKAEASIAQLTESIAATEKFLADLAKTQLEMDQMRKDEKAAYAKVKKDYEDGIEGLTMALQVLREYYAQGESFVQQPEVGVHAASTGAATGIIGMLEVAQSDFTKLLADATVEEETAQRDYDKQTQENAVQKTMKAADVKYQVKEKASLEKNVAEYKEDSEGEQAELDAVLEYYAQVKPGCTTKPMTYEERKARRESEIAGLKSALQILEAEAEAPEAFLALRAVRKSH